MAVRIVTYDLNAERRKSDDYHKLLKLIKEYPWAKLSESSYAIATDKQPKELFEEFSAPLDSNDYLLVLTLNQPWWGTQQQDVMDWLLQSL